jgi:hypothetical protein
MKFMTRMLPVLFLVLASFLSQAADNCTGSAEGSKEYIKATKLIESLPEFNKWTKSHRLPIAFGEPMDSKTLNEGICYWSVSVYADQGSRLELWNIFLVPVFGQKILVQDPIEGDYVSLNQWRKKRP